MRLLPESAPANERFWTLGADGGQPEFLGRSV